MRDCLHTCTPDGVEKCLKLRQDWIGHRIWAVFCRFVTVTASEANDPVYGRFSDSICAGEIADKQKQQPVQQLAREKKPMKERVFYSANVSTDVKQVIKRCLMCKDDKHCLSGCSQFERLAQADHYKFVHDR